MKNYTIKNKKIIVKNLSEFNITHILECGQIFRYKKYNDHYDVFSKNKKASVFSYSDRVEILSDDINYFIRFFDLETNYTDIKNQLSSYNFLKPILSTAYGIRILKQDEFEMIISFIISANNNIKRIQLIIENICKRFGTNMGNYFAFPTREQLLNASIEDFNNCGAGYRAKYLYTVVRQLENFNYNHIKEHTSKESLPFLLKLSGIGPKVADCILLFAFNKFDVFPVDTWIKKVYNEYFTQEKTDNINLIRKDLINIFGNLSGYAQQYLFYYKRSLENKK